MEFFAKCVNARGFKMKHVYGFGLWWIGILTGLLGVFIVFMTMTPVIDGLIDGVRGSSNEALPDGSQGERVISRMSNMLNVAFLLMVAMLILYGIVRVLREEPQSRYYEGGYYFGMGMCIK